jgi:hypothetical protein
VTPATGTRLVIDNVDPALLVSANRRIHHHQRAKICAHWRHLAAATVRAEYGHADPGESWYPTAHITLHIRFPDRRETHHRRPRRRTVDPRRRRPTFGRPRHAPRP